MMVCDVFLVCGNGELEPAVYKDEQDETRVDISGKKMISNIGFMERTDPTNHLN